MTDDNLREERPKQSDPHKRPLLVPISAHVDDWTKLLLVQHPEGGGGGGGGGGRGLEGLTTRGQVRLYT